MDVTNEDAVNAGAAAFVGAYGGIDILVGNAGIQIVHPADQFSYSTMSSRWRFCLPGFRPTRSPANHWW